MDVTNMERENDAPRPLGQIFQKNRWWSNPGLSDVDTMIALILVDPTRVDLALAAALWGTKRIERVRSRIEDELTPVHLQVLDPIYASVLSGVRNAPERAS
ncbi:hypothetical protein NZL82_19050 [Sphingomonas sanguinis]|uniref:hypothetical protein n=1 Tax=Sphingomonas sp. LC-1 TaxID=3110957 RepID=UPI0021BA4281|nr:hypothetical protein [Sphingomonas sp. LC-1]MCT8003966.1 hypothetical protein [Sphingomonas sp. LC-1]